MRWRHSGTHADHGAAGRTERAFALPHADRVYVLERARTVWEDNPVRFAQEAGAAYL